MPRFSATLGAGERHREAPRRTRPLSPVGRKKCAAWWVSWVHPRHNGLCYANIDLRSWQDLPQEAALGQGALARRGTLHLRFGGPYAAGLLPARAGARAARLSRGGRGVRPPVRSTGDLPALPLRRAVLGGSAILRPYRSRAQEIHHGRRRERTSSCGDGYPIRFGRSAKG